MKLLLLVSVAIAGPAVAQSKWNPDVASVPVAQCSVQEVTSRMKFQGIEGAANLANGQMPILGELERLNSKAKDDKRPVGEQLSAADNARFGELTQRLKVGQLGDYVESRRQRDATELQRLVQVADREYRFGPQDEGDNKEAILSGVLVAMRQIAQGKDWPTQIEVPNPGTCSFAVAVKKLADAGFERMRETDSDGPATVLSMMAKRYGVKTIDTAKLSPADRTEYARVRQEMEAPIAAYHYVTDLRDIVAIADAMDINYRAMKQDIVAGGGDMDTIGKTVDTMMADGRIDEQTVAGLRAVKIINEKIPADAIEQWEQIGKAAKSAN